MYLKQIMEYVKETIYDNQSHRNWQLYKLKHFLPKDTSLLEGSLQGNQNPLTLLIFDDSIIYA